MFVHKTAAVLTVAAATVGAQEHLSLLQTSAAKSSLAKEATNSTNPWSNSCGPANKCHGCYEGTDYYNGCASWGTDNDAQKMTSEGGQGTCFGWIKYGVPYGSKWSQWQWNGVWNDKPNSPDNIPGNDGRFTCNAATFGGDPAPGGAKECWCCGAPTRPCQVGEGGCPFEQSKRRHDNLLFKCPNIDDAEWVERKKAGVPKPLKEKKCKVSKATRAEIAAAKAARKAAKKAVKDAKATLKAAATKAAKKAARAALKEARAALKAARAALKKAKAKGKAECEDK